MDILTDLTQKFLDLSSEGFVGGGITHSPESSQATFWWETSLTKEEFLSSNSGVHFGSHDLAENFGAKPQWTKESDSLVSVSFPIPESDALLDAVSETFSVESSIVLKGSKKWHVRGYFTGAQSPEDLPEECMARVKELSESLNSSPVWMLEGEKLVLRLSGDVVVSEAPQEIPESRVSFYDADFVRENKGSIHDWQFSLVDLKEQGHTAEEVAEMFLSLDEEVIPVEENDSEEVSEAGLKPGEPFPDSSAVVKDYGVVEDTVANEKVLYFIIGKSDLEYRYIHTEWTAEEALEEFKENVRKVTGSLGISWNKFVKANPDFTEIMTSRAAKRAADFEETYISPKDVEGSITARQAHKKSVAVRTGKRS